MRRLMIYEVALELEALGTQPTPVHFLVVQPGLDILTVVRKDMPAP